MLYSADFMSEVLVIGHRNPDADSICSALGYAEFKRLTGTANAVACRCGDTNDRINFILSNFKVETPRFVPDITPKVADIMRTRIEAANEDDTALDVLSAMDEKNIRVMPIINKAGELKGLVSVFKLCDYFLPARHRLGDTRRILGSLGNISRSLSGKILHSVNEDVQEDLILMIAAMKLESFSLRLQNFPPSKIVLVVGDRREIQETAILSKVRLIIITGGLAIDDDILARAKETGVSIIVSPYDSATSAWLIRSSVPIINMVHTDFTSFPPEMDLEDARSAAAESSQNTFPVLSANNLLGIFSKSDFMRPVDKQIILVDHNELSQAVRGAEQATILEIIDHHKIGALTTNQPILFLNEPVGSTSTIVADQFFKNNIALPPSIAGVLLSGLISDTLLLKSPTATPKDKVILDRLAEIAGVNPSELAEKLFASGSVLSIKAPADAILADCKEYIEDQYHFSVAQVEELGFSHFWDKKDILLEELYRHVQRHQYLFAALLVTDINTNSSYLLVRGADQYLDTIDNQKVEPYIYELAGVVSRKKQLLPYLLRCLSKMKIS